MLPSGSQDGNRIQVGSAKDSWSPTGLDAGSTYIPVPGLPGTCPPTMGKRASDAPFTSPTRSRGTCPLAQVLSLSFPCRVGSTRVRFSFKRRTLCSRPSGTTPSWPGLTLSLQPALLCPRFLTSDSCAPGELGWLEELRENRPPMGFSRLSLRLPG